MILSCGLQKKKEPQRPLKQNIFYVPLIRGAVHIAVCKEKNENDLQKLANGTLPTFAKKVATKVATTFPQVKPQK